MESERADVSTLVLFLLLKALLKLAVFLETVFLCHLALLLFSLYDTTFRTEVLQLTIKHLIFAEFAFQ